MPENRVHSAFGTRALQEADANAKSTALMGSSPDATQDNYMKEIALTALVPMLQILINEITAFRKDIRGYYMDSKFGSKQ